MKKFSSILLTGLMAFCFISCNENEAASDTLFPSEFYLLENNCFGRFFYENPLTGELEYELYCSGIPMAKFSVGTDTVSVKTEFSRTAFTISEFYEEYGKPINVSRVNHNKLHFKIDTLGLEMDSVGHLETDAMHRVKLQIEKENEILYDKVFKCNRLVLFDSSNINVYIPEGRPELYFIDGVSPCLVLEMEYYDEDGIFAGWERFSADIKAFPKKK